MVDRLRRNLVIAVPAALALRPFAAVAQAPLRLEITEGVVEPMPFAIAVLRRRRRRRAGALAGQITRVVADDLTGTGLFREIPAVGPRRQDHQLRRAGAVRGLEGDQRAGADHRGGRHLGRPGASAFPALGRLRPDRARRGPEVRGTGWQLAAAGAQGRRCRLFAADRRGRLFRQQGRLYRGQRAQGGAAEAARDHGLRWGERGDADGRRRAGPDAAAVSERAARCSIPATSAAPPR